MEGNPLGLRRDPASQAVLVTDTEALAAYKLRRQARKRTENLLAIINSIEQRLVVLEAAVRRLSNAKE